MRSVVFLLALLALPCPGQPRVVSVDIDSVIHPVTVEVVGHAIAQAHSQNAALVLLRLNTPGGLLEATRQTIEAIAASPVPIVSFVTPSGGRAASAGFFLLLAGDVAAMAEGTHTGAAAPVTLGEPLDPVMRRKIESDTAASVRSLAARHQRNGEAAEKAVFEAKSFTSEEALKERLIDLVVRDEAQLWARLDGREVVRPGGAKAVLRTAGAVVTPYQPTLRERVVLQLADPNLAFLILVLGGLLLYVEFTQPGMILPGVAGAIMVLLGLLALSVLPINGAAAALLVLAVVLFALEAKLASHGVLAAGGAVAMVIGAMLLVEGPPVLRIRFSTALAVTLPFTLITVFLLSLVVRARLRPAVTGEAGLLNETGFASTDLSPKGMVFVHGEYWSAVASAPIPQGARVRVAAVEGLLLKVEPAP